MSDNGIEEVREEELDFEIVDDTPEDDRGKEADPKRLRSDEDLTSEVEDLTEAQQKRFNELTFRFHDERRKKEQAERMSQEAVAHSKSLYSQNAELQEVLTGAEKTLLSQIKGRADSDAEAAKVNLRAAHEEGDTEKMAAATQELARSAADKSRAESYVPQPPQVPYQPQYQPPQAEAQIYRDPKFQEWRGNNQWWESDTEMTNAAKAIHGLLVTRGHHPLERPEEYYEEVDKRIRQEFPDRFPGEEPSAPKKSVVAPANRRPKQKRKVTLTQTEVDYAKHLGISNEIYAKEKERLEQEV